MAEDKIVVNSEDIDQVVGSSLHSWLNDQGDLSPEIRDILAKRAEDLRLKIQVFFMEFQRQHVTDMAFDLKFESEIRRELRSNYPFLTSSEKVEVLKSLGTNNEDRIARLESQVQGFDLFSNIAYALNTMSSPIPSVLAEKVKSLSPLKRQHLLGLMGEVKKEILALENNLVVDAEVIKDKG